MGNPAIYQLFVYGSLRSGFRSPAYEYISRYFTLAGEGKVRGRMYDMGEYPAAVPSEDDSFVIGELYIIKNENEFSWAIGQIDDYEGVGAEPGEPQCYVRGVADVIINNSITPAWMYWYNGDTTGRPVIASGDILDYIKNK
jgi:gamma-glutamylcyclotransferase (GGCT)/AIG2-like uncharacterized protein YtfP